MGVTLSVLLFLVAVIVIWAIIMYNGLVVLKHNVSQAWSNIDVLLKQRHDELPKLVETAKQYMKYEQETLEKVMRARSAVRGAQDRGDIDALGMAEGQLRAGLMDFYAVAEAYPDLKANTSFQHLQQRISGLENMIADRREFYNASVNINNVRIEQFPDVLIAQLFRFRPFKLLTFREDELKDVDLKTLFNQ
ncbi:LemA family protein [Halothiobacillus neapolitanus]|jgi:LemA protein|uniref:LemA family protein n=1 Tax=Halothiobacillus neapolitanus (strain ATCC 23641 / DSM 15147 / CIP 104769 / NCIMB 8539 / c2) TaxID=555778 RepID=D0KVU4_HALNC|nr:LemA family protein [Halothiobacillus neapolitanus]ACX94871.1 LemA family protein [Halothiobacillus neapolitanus c2]OZB82645.1 MAG: LemA family protein [Halothiobacillus sp. 13-55-253]TDN60363.1 LemA protein [Halothiobacillus neapolitanus]